MSGPWTGHGTGKAGRYLEHPSGWLVRHCGHPTALYPWYVESPEGVTYTSPSGACWSHLADAQRIAERLAAGETGPAWPISQASRVRAEQKALPYAGAARKRMKPERRQEQAEGLARTDAERWRWVRMTHAETLEALEGSSERAG